MRVKFYINFICLVVDISSLRLRRMPCFYYLGLYFPFFGDVVNIIKANLGNNLQLPSFRLTVWSIYQHPIDFYRVFFRIHSFSGPAPNIPRTNPEPAVKLLLWLLISQLFYCTRVGGALLFVIAFASIIRLNNYCYEIKIKGIIIINQVNKTVWKN